MSYNYKENKWVSTDSSGDLRHVRRHDGTRAIGALTEDGMKQLTVQVENGVYDGWTVSRLVSGDVFMVEEAA